MTLFTYYVWIPYLLFLVLYSTSLDAMKMMTVVIWTTMRLSPQCYQTKRNSIQVRWRKWSGVLHCCWKRLVMGRKYSPDKSFLRSFTFSEIFLIDNNRRSLPCRPLSIDLTGTSFVKVKMHSFEILVLVKNHPRQKSIRLTILYPFFFLHFYIFYRELHLSESDMKCFQPEQV